MAVKVKELKDDIMVDITVNKSYYLMLKQTLHFLFEIVKDEKARAAKIKKVTDGNYAEMDAYERSFYTISLALAEIERKAKEESLYNEKEVLEPGDEGYVAPTQE
jgi:hypothetical protein